MEHKIGSISFKSVDKEWDVYFDMALTMLNTIRRNNKLGKKTVMIVPVGPTDQYPILARLVNELGVSLKNVWFFNMDEYMLSPTEMISSTDKLSFAKRMQDEFYSKVDPDLIMPISQRVFPTVFKEAEYDALIESLGGVDLCLGGLGINGHIAFNEPPEDGQDIPAKDFALLPTRVLPISRETKTINAYGYQRGDLRGMPEWCITVGMKQILASKQIYIALNRPWQHGIVKRALFTEPTSKIPASLLQWHNSVTICAYKDVAEGLFN
ncbi:MAG: glucosamine-6-phosphate isomerase [Clostridia bacterium]|nr:glucosamine-6-phosphate isomerase [Clostridia bacterium]